MAIVYHEALHAFISTGEQTKMYTYRELFRVDYITRCGDGRIDTRPGTRAVHVTNLSTNKERAVAKAKLLAQSSGLELRGNADFDLETIRREKREVYEQRRVAVQRAEQAQAEQARAEYANYVSRGVMLVGKHQGLTPAEIVENDPINGRGYLQYFADQYREDVVTAGNATALLASEYLQANPIEDSKWIGEVGSKVTVAGTVVKAQWTQSQFPSYMVKFVDALGNKLMLFTTAKAFVGLDTGDTIAVAATVKKHDVDAYDRGQHVTLLVRPKLIGENLSALELASYAIEAA